MPHPSNPICKQIYTEISYHSDCDTRVFPILDRGGYFVRPDVMKGRRGVLLSVTMISHQREGQECAATTELLDFILLGGYSQYRLMGGLSRAA